MENPLGAVSWLRLSGFIALAGVITCKHGIQGKLFVIAPTPANDLDVVVLRWAGIVIWGQIITDYIIIYLNFLEVIK